MNSEKTGTILVCGTGITEDGRLVGSCLSNLRKAFELYHVNPTTLIFSGKWAWGLPKDPPITEARAMKKVALVSGIPEEDILIEEKSVTTGSNICLVKRDILIPQEIKNITVISPSEILFPRLRLNLDMILGPGYTSEIISSHHPYPSEVLKKLRQSEEQKMPEARKFYQGITPGDHETIYKLGMEDVNKKLKQL